MGRLVVNYELRPDLNVYASVSRGRRPPVITIDGTQTMKLPAEILWSYEAGAKGIFADGKMQFDTAFYTYEYTDFSTTVVKDLQLIPVNAGNATATGFEVSVSALLTPGLSVFANYGFIDAKFDDFDSSGNPQAFANNRFRLTPEHSASVGLNWLHNFNGIGNVFFTPTYTWKSKVFFTDDPNEADITQGDYGLLNARLGLRSGRWEVSTFVTNALDKDYLIDGGNVGRDLGLPTFIAGPPRLFGIEVTASF